MALVVKNLPANAGDVRGAGSIPGWGRSPGEGNGNPLQYSCLENPMDKGAWWATVHKVANSQIRWKRLICSSKVTESGKDGDGQVGRDGRIQSRRELETKRKVDAERHTSQDNND